MDTNKPLATSPKILIVDDDPICRGFVRFLLELELKVLSETAGSGEEALEMLKKRPFEIVISDMRMAKMSGLELLDQLRKLHPTVKVIIMSGDLGEFHVSEKELLERGATGAVHKDEIASGLVHLLKELMKGVNSR